MTHEWKPGQVFVFGSNIQGVHGAGAAKFAREHCGAELGRGHGHVKWSYALVTCAEPGVAVPLEVVRLYARQFNQYAAGQPDLTFFLTRVGCGIAGFTDAQINPLFQPRLSNVIYPPEWG